MSKMLAEAATAVPGNAPVAAYLDLQSQPVPADLLGSLIATEAKAVHQVMHKIAAFKLSMSGGTQLVLHVCLDSCLSGVTDAHFHQAWLTL